MRIRAAILAAALGLLTPWLATAASDPASAQQPAAASSYSEGELKKIDTEQKFV